MSFSSPHSSGFKSALAFWLAACLAGCGGGGGSADTPNTAPTASARLSGEAVAQAVTRFDVTGTADPDGSIASRSWAYGDGQSGTADEHVYATPGSYTATLSVTDNRGATASAQVAVTVARCSAAGSAAAGLSPFPTVCMQTTRGELVMEVYPAIAPVTATNFLDYVREGFYAGTLFHRVIPGFVAQAGGFTTGLRPKAATRGPIVLESNNGLSNWRYTLAMARTPVPNSATSEFYVNLVDNPGLDFRASVGAPNGYAVFGQVISGTDVIDGIGTVTTGSAGGLANVPLTEIVIRGALTLP